MRILTLVADRDAVTDATRLSGEIRAFNREIDFRLRFLHIDIEESFAAPAEVAENLDTSDAANVHVLEIAGPLEAAASLALLLDRERPALLVVAGGGELLDAAAAAAAVAKTKLAVFGPRRGSRDGVIDLGEEAGTAVERIRGVAKEIG